MNSKKLLLTFIISLFFSTTDFAQMVYYVSDQADPWKNWDIYAYDLSNNTETRLTTNNAIDNHPSISHIDSTQLVFSSNRGNGEFDLYLAQTSNVPGTATRLTNNNYPDRHPHWHTNKSLIVYTSKDRPFSTLDTLATECSQPIITLNIRYYEGINLMDPNSPSNITQLTIADAWDSLSNPGIWVANDSAVYVGHPSFNHDGDQMIFTAAIDGDGKNWEVYIVGFDTSTVSLVPNSLRRVTFGPNVGSNPIKLTGGASFTHDGSQIVLNSTRTTGGNSQIFIIPAASQNLAMNNTFRATHHHGNDYVPEPLEDGRIIVTSDLGISPICNCDTMLGATDDLDVVLLDTAGSGALFCNRTIIGSDSSQQTILLADEVSWFCGYKPNLTTCTFQARIMSLEALWLEANPGDLLFPDLLAGYSSAYANNAISLYSTGWMNLSDYLGAAEPNLMNQIWTDMSLLWNGFNGYSDLSFTTWYNSTDSLRSKKYVVPSIMYGGGLGDSCVYIGGTGCVPSGIDKININQTFGGISISPNPFSTVTNIQYELKRPGKVHLEIFDLLGNKIQTLNQTYQVPGSYQVDFDAQQLPSGVYLCRLQVDKAIQTKKLLLIR